MVNINGTELGITEIILCFIVVIVVLKALMEGGKVILGYLNIYTSKKVEKQEILDTIEDIKKSLEDIKNDNVIIKGQIEDSKSMNENQLQALKTSTRHAIIRACEEYLDMGEIESYELKSLEDLYSSYKNNLNGNSYARDLIHEVRELLVVNKHVKEDKK